MPTKTTAAPVPRSLVWATDLDVLPPDRVIERREGYLVVRSPGNPGHHWGNLLVFDEPPRPGDGDRWESLFGAEFGADRRVRHRTFAWDRADGEAGAARDFSRKRLADRRRLFRAGRGAWFVANDPVSNDVVASCGVVVTGGRGRFQAVETALEHRRRGICSRLVVEAARRAAEAYGAERFVIVAEAGYHALVRAAAAEDVPVPQALKVGALSFGCSDLVLSGGLHREGPPSVNCETIVRRRGAERRPAPDLDSAPTTLLETPRNPRTEDDDRERRPRAAGA